MLAHLRQTFGMFSHETPPYLCEKRVWTRIRRNTPLSHELAANKSWAREDRFPGPWQGMKPKSKQGEVKSVENLVNEIRPASAPSARTRHAFVTSIFVLTRKQTTLWAILTACQTEPSTTHGTPARKSSGSATLRRNPAKLGRCFQHHKTIQG